MSFSKRWKLIKLLLEIYLNKRAKACHSWRSTDLMALRISSLMSKSFRPVSTLWLMAQIRTHSNFVFLFKKSANLSKAKRCLTYSSMDHQVLERLLAWLPSQKRSMVPSTTGTWHSSSTPVTIVESMLWGTRLSHSVALSSWWAVEWNSSFWMNVTQWLQQPSSHSEEVSETIS